MDQQLEQSPSSIFWLERGQRLALVLFLLNVVGFGVIVEIRSAYLKRRMTDLNVYLRAAWAVRVGENLYRITDDNGWHYHYPPLLAILLTPLADPPAGADRTGYLPFAASVAVWYVLSLLCLAGAVHLLAGALEHGSFHHPSRLAEASRWLAWRLWPVLACFMPLAQTLARGQVNLLVMLLLCGMAAAELRGRSWLAGWCLAGAIGVKLIPAFLLLYPAWRRDYRALAGCAAGLMLGFIVLPAAIFGPAGTMKLYEEWNQALLRPGLGQTGDDSRIRELITVSHTDSQSWLTILHNWQHPERTLRPTTASLATRLVALLLGAPMTLLTLLARGAKGARDGPTAVLFLGTLAIDMILLSPVCHLHYFCLTLPLVAGLIAAAWEARDRRRAALGLAALLAVNMICGVAPSLPGLEKLRDFGLAMWSVLGVWAVGIAVLYRRIRAPDKTTDDLARPSRNQMKSFANESERRSFGAPA